MKPPKTKTELIDIINAMEHRERIRFTALDSVRGDAAYIELYCTEIDAPGFTTNINIKVTVCDICQQPLKPVAGNTINRYLRLFDDKYYTMIFNLITVDQAKAA